MDSITDPDLDRVRTRLLDSMQGYLQSFEDEGGEAPYAAADIMARPGVAHPATPEIRGNFGGHVK